MGSGIAGLTAAYVLQRNADVTLYEAEPRVGGHSNTHDIVDRGEFPFDGSQPASGPTLAVDSGFIVHNERNYPTLLRLFRELGVQTQDAEMSMSVSCAGCGLEYAGAKGLRGLFAQPRSLSRPAYLRMLAEVPRFHRAARKLLAQEREPDLPLADFLAAGKYSQYFVHHFITPLVAAVWSCAPSTAGRYPARYLFTFLDNHGYLSVNGSPQWKTVTGGSRRYVERVGEGAVGRPHGHARARLAPACRTAAWISPTTAIRRSAMTGSWWPRMPTRRSRCWRTRPRASARCSGSFGFSANETLLHTDTQRAALRRPARPHGTTGWRPALTPPRASWSATT